MERTGFVSLHFSQDGIRLTQSKTEAIMKAGRPNDAKELRSLYGLVNYCSKFIRDAATLITRLSCKCNYKKKHFHPLQMSKLPNSPWEELAADFHGPLESGEYMMVVIDEYSRFPIVKILKSIKSETVIQVLKDTFNVFGYPKQLKTDNGPSFQGYEFKTFLYTHNVKHRKITPLWPRANAICERFMRNLNRVMRNCKVTGAN